MSKGFEKHQERKRQISLFGKGLRRRSGGHCELCGRSSVSLNVFEAPPETEEPEFDNCLFLCEACADQISSPKKIQPEYWRCLSETIWSDVPIAQVMAARILDHLSKKDMWAGEILEEACLDDAIVERVKRHPL